MLVAVGLQFSQPDLPATLQPVHQTDGWSCGWHTVSRFEEAYRQFRGEGFCRQYCKPDHRRTETNRWAASLVNTCWKPPVGVSPELAVPPLRLRRQSASPHRSRQQSFLGSRAVAALRPGSSSCCLPHGFGCRSLPLE